MTIKKIITLILGTLLNCNLFTSMSNFSTLPSDSLEWSYWHPPKSIPKNIFKVITELPDELQIPLAQHLLTSNLGGKANLTTATVKTLHGHTSLINSIALSHDGKLLASASNDKTIKIWDTTSWQNIQTLHGHTDTVDSVGWSFDGRFLASGSRDRSFKIWDAVSWKNIKTFQEHGHVISAVEWSPDGTLFASGSRDGTVKIWDTASWRNLETLRGHGSEVATIRWNPDGRKLAICGVGPIKIWDAVSWQNTQIFKGHDSMTNSVNWSPDGTQLVFGSLHGGIQIFDTTSWENIKTIKTDYTYSPVFSPNGKLIASAASLGGYITIWDAELGQSIQTIKKEIVTGNITIKWSPDGKYLASLPYGETIKILSFPQPLLTKKEFDSLTIEQALFLILLYSKRPTFKNATHKPLSLENLHKDLSGSDALGILLSFSPETQARIQKRYNIINASRAPKRIYTGPAAAAAEILPDIEPTDLSQAMEE